jgi:hypothetical protein
MIGLEALTYQGTGLLDVGIVIVERRLNELGGEGDRWRERRVVMEKESFLGMRVVL